MTVDTQWLWVKGKRKQENHICMLIYRLPCVVKKRAVANLSSWVGRCLLKSFRLMLYYWLRVHIKLMLNKTLIEQHFILLQQCCADVARKHTLRLASLYTILLKRRWQNGLFSINLVRAAVEICGQSLTLSHISLGQVSSKTSNAWSDNEVQYASPSRSISSQLLAIAVMVRSVICLQNRSSNTLSLFMEARIKSASTASLHLPFFVFVFVFESSVAGQSGLNWLGWMWGLNTNYI